MNEHCRGCIRYMKSCSGMTKRLCEKHKLRIPITNAYKIRAMTDEELATKFWMFTCVHAFDNKVKCKDDGCRKCWLAWLKEEVTE